MVNLRGPGADDIHRDPANARAHSRAAIRPHRRTGAESTPVNAQCERSHYSCQAGSTPRVLTRLTRSGGSTRGPARSWRRSSLGHRRRAARRRSRLGSGRRRGRMVLPRHRVGIHRKVAPILNAARGDIRTHQKARERLAVEPALSHARGTLFQATRNRLHLPERSARASCRLHQLVPEAYQRDLFDAALWRSPASLVTPRDRGYPRAGRSALTLTM